MSDITLSDVEQAQQALAAMRQRLVELDGWTWEANYEMVARVLRQREDLREAFVAIRDIPGAQTLLLNAEARAMYEIAIRALASFQERDPAKEPSDACF